MAWIMSFPGEKSDDPKDILIVVSKYVMASVDLDKHSVLYFSLPVLHNKTEVTFMYRMN